MKEFKERIEILRQYFLKRPDIVMAFIFGSQANNLAMAESDADIAVYFKPASQELEWEEERTYPNEDQIWSDVEKIIGLRTDLVVLNRAPAALASSVVEGGEPIIIKDERLYRRFWLAVSAAAEDFRDFVTDFWHIKEHSQSLSSVDKERLMRTVDFLEAELGDGVSFKNLTRKTYETDAALRRNVERWAENIVNASIDIAKIILASEKKRLPQTYREILEELAQLENFDEGNAQVLAKFSKLRNILAHEYLDIRFNHIRDFIREYARPYRAIVDFVKGKL